LLLAEEERRRGGEEERGGKREDNWGEDLIYDEDQDHASGLRVCHPAV
jgi:hypothetical protein